MPISKYQVRTPQQRNFDGLVLRVRHQTRWETEWWVLSLSPQRAGIKLSHRQITIVLPMSASPDVELDLVGVG